MQKRSEQLERINSDLKSKLDEVSGLYDAAQRDNRNKASEIVRLNHELDKTREAKDQLTRENKKLTGKMTLTPPSLPPAIRTHFPCHHSVFLNEII